jgi:hypothetical protein
MTILEYPLTSAIPNKSYKFIKKNGSEEQGMSYFFFSNIRVAVYVDEY